MQKGKSETTNEKRKLEKWKLENETVLGYARHRQLEAEQAGPVHRQRRPTAEHVTVPEHEVVHEDRESEREQREGRRDQEREAEAVPRRGGRIDGSRRRHVAAHRSLVDEALTEPPAAATGARTAP